MKESLFDKIIHKLIEGISDADHSLVNGKSGILIALSYYYSFNLNENIRKEVDDGIHQCIEGILSDLETKEIDSSLAFGFTGMTYALRIAYDLGQKQKIDIEWFDDLNELAIKSLDNYIEIKEYDLLRGASGIILYLLRFYPKKELFFKYVESLCNQAVWKDENTCYWIFYSFNEEKKEMEYRHDIINLGLAHGVSGIITILSEIYNKGFYKEKCFKMINGAINYLKTIQNQESQCQFPGIVYYNVEQQNSSKLGWCYGDSSIGLSIIKAGQYCKNEDWYHYGNEICLKSTERNLENAGLDEHGICHGYFGTMHIYNRLYKATNNNFYRERKEYWYKIGMQMRDFDIDDLGFYQVDFHSSGVFQKYSKLGYLQGLSGIYLCLASYVNIKYSWDSSLLIAIEK